MSWPSCPIFFHTSWPPFAAALRSPSLIGKTYVDHWQQRCRREEHEPQSAGTFLVSEPPRKLLPKVFQTPMQSDKDPERQRSSDASAQVRLPECHCITIQVLFFSSPARAVYDSEGSHVQTRSTTQAKERERNCGVVKHSSSSMAAPPQTNITKLASQLLHQYKSISMNPTSPLLHAFRWISYQCARLLS